MLCLITRPEDESPLEINIQQHVQQQPIEQMTFKLDIHGKILTLDPTALREPFKQHLQTWVGRLWQDLCHPHDLSTLKSHLRDIQDSASANSPGAGAGTSVVSRPFRLRLGAPDVYVHVKANSRLFLNQTPGEGDFIMSVQTLLNSENDMNSSNTGAGSGGLGLGQLCAMAPSPSLASSLLSSLSMDGLHGGNGSGSSSSPAASGMLPTHLLGGLVGGGQQGGGGNSTQTTSVGGPLMSSAIINGTGLQQQQQQQQRSGASSSASSSANALVNAFTASPAPAEHSFYGSDTFEFDIAAHSSSFELDPSGGVGAWTDSRPNSRASVATPVSTPRPPSGHGFSPAVCASPATPYQLSSHSAASLPSPQSNASAGGGNYGGFNFHSFDSSDVKPEKDVQQQQNQQQSNNNSSSSNPLLGGGLPNGVGGMLLSQQQQQQQTPPQQQQQQQQQESSERLRHLLTKSQSMAGGLGGLGDDEKVSPNVRFWPITRT